jgi:hypothetical protein
MPRHKKTPKSRKPPGGAPARVAGDASHTRENDYMGEDASDEEMIDEKTGCGEPEEKAAGAPGCSQEETMCKAQSKTTPGPAPTLKTPRKRKENW